MNFYYLAIKMEKGDTSMSKFIESKEKLTYNKYIKIFDQAINAILCLIKVYRIIHRDIKPDNILMNQELDDWIV